MATKDSGGKKPTTPTIGNASQSAGIASVPFTPSSYIGKGTVTYTATSTTTQDKSTSSSSPIIIGARKNLVVNPSARTNTHGWTQNGPTLARDAGNYAFGFDTACLSLTNSATTDYPNAYQTAWIPVSAGVTYYYSAYAKNLSGNTRTMYIAAQFYQSNQSTYISEINSAGGFPSTTVAEGWKRLSCSGVAPVGAAFVRILILNGTTGNSVGLS